MAMPRHLAPLAALWLVLLARVAHAAVGLDVIPATGTAGPITLFYPSSGMAAPLTRGSFTLSFAAKGEPAAGNRRLIVLSHGSGGAPWPQSDLAKTLAEAGFVVAMPEHQGDNWHDHSKVGPESWKLRPAEISHAIDAVGQEARFATLLDLNKVGVYGMSAGGQAALTVAGGRWSPANFARYCDKHIEQDFPACVGLATRLKGNLWDGLKTTLARTYLNWRFSDETLYSHHDPRIQAVVAAVPAAAMFDLDSLRQPQTALGLVQADQDRWLAPAAHVGAVRAACQPCELVADLPLGGHGAVLSPLPGDLPPAEALLVGDAPGFQRDSLPAVYQKIASFFQRHL